MDKDDLVQAMVAFVKAVKTFDYENIIAFIIIRTPHENRLITYFENRGVPTSEFDFKMTAPMRGTHMNNFLLNKGARCLRY